MNRELRRLFLRRWFAHLFSMCIFSLLLGHSLIRVSLAQSSTDQERHLFAYVSNAQQQDSVAVALFDPVSPQPIIPTLHIPLPSGLLFGSAQVSPDGRWLALVSGRYADVLRIQLFNIATRQIYEVAQLHYVWDSSSQSRYLPMWSPDSTMFAFIGTLQTEAASAVFVFRLDDLTLHKVLEEQEGYPTIAPYRLQWTPDSAALGIVQLQCRNLLCVQILEKWSTPELELITRVEYDPFEGSGSATFVCLHDWSPDGRYLSFELICDDFSGLYFKHVYVWDTLTNTVIQLTADINPPSESRQIREYSVVYNLLWLADDQLLLSISGGYLEPGRGVLAKDSLETVEIVRFPEIARTTLNAHSRALFALTPNPVTNTFAYVAHQHVEDQNGIRLLQDVSVEITAVEREMLSPSFVGLAGCNLSWSPDGRILAYSRARLGAEGYFSCLRSSSLIFVNTNGYQVFVHPLPQVDSLELIGWIAMPTNATDQQED